MKSTMKRRAPKGVTLARFQSWDPIGKCIVNDRDAEKRAEENRPKAGTPQRLAKASEVEVGADKVQRVTEAPLDVLAKRRAFDKLDKDGNPDKAQGDACFLAGDLFRKEWHAAGLTGIGAMDMGRVGSGEGHPAWSMQTSEYMEENRALVRNAKTWLGEWMAQFVVLIVAEELSPEEVGRLITGRVDKATCRSIAIEVLTAALGSLARHYRERRRS